MLIECANPTTLTVTVNPKVDPVFDPIERSAKAEPLRCRLLLTMVSVVPGHQRSTMLLRLLIRSHRMLTECANPTTLTVTVNPKVDPVFDPIDAICDGGTFTLPTLLPMVSVVPGHQRSTMLLQQLIRSHLLLISVRTQRH